MSTLAKTVEQDPALAEALGLAIATKQMELEAEVARLREEADAAQWAYLRAKEKLARHTRAFRLAQP